MRENRNSQMGMLVRNLQATNRISYRRETVAMGEITGRHFCFFPLHRAQHFFPGRNSHRKSTDSDSPFSPTARRHRRHQSGASGAGGGAERGLSMRETTGRDTGIRGVSTTWLVESCCKFMNISEHSASDEGCMHTSTMLAAEAPPEPHSIVGSACRGAPEN